MPNGRIPPIGPSIAPTKLKRVFEKRPVFTKTRNSSPARQAPPFTKPPDQAKMPTFHEDAQLATKVRSSAPTTYSSARVGGNRGRGEGGRSCHRFAKHWTEDAQLNQAKTPRFLEDAQIEAS
jgi:hypothetical protein